MWGGIAAGEEEPEQSPTWGRREAREEVRQMAISCKAIL